MTDECVVAWRALQTAIINAGTLAPIDWTHPLVLCTDAPDYG